MLSTGVPCARSTADPNGSRCMGVSTRSFTALRPDYIEHQPDGGDGGATGEGRFAFRTALEPVGHRRFGGC